MRVAALLCVVLATACQRRGLPVRDPAPLTDMSTVFRYPIDEWDNGKEGQTLLMVHVTEQGGVDSSFVAKSSGYTAFDSAAIADVQRVRFAPGRRGEKRIAMWVRLPVRFSRNGKTMGVRP